MIADLKTYSVMKDSGVEWLGDVPEHWEVLPGHACVYGKQESNLGMVEDTVLSLSYGRIIVKPKEKLRGLVPESFETYQVIDPGDVICRPTDLQNDHTSLRFGIAKNRGIITSAYICFSVRKRYLARFGYLLFHAYDLKKIFYGFGSGLRQNLSWKDFKSLPCVVPPLSEQGAIVRFLNHMDQRAQRCIRAKQKLIGLLEEQKKAIIHQAVTRGLNPDAPMKDSGVEWLGDVPEHWGIWQIGHFSRVGNGSTPSRGNAAYWTNGYFPWLNSSFANQDRIIEAKEFVTDVALKECHLPVVRPGSVVVAITGQGKTRGKAALLKIESTINQHLAYITPTPGNASAAFLHLVLDAAYSHLRMISEDSGSTKGALTCSDLKHFKVALPPLGEQKSILELVSAERRKCDEILSRSKCEIELLGEYRTRLIADVVTGKLDVREAAAKLPDCTLESAPLASGGVTSDSFDTAMEVLGR